MLASNFSIAYRYLTRLLFILLCVLLIPTSSVMSYLVHPAVLANDADEALLPDHFRRSRLVTPTAYVALAQSSWFGDGEKEVVYIVIFKYLISIFDYCNCILRD